MRLSISKLVFTPDYFAGTGTYSSDNTPKRHIGDADLVS